MFCCPMRPATGMNSATTMLLALVPAGWPHSDDHRLLQAHAAVHPDRAAQDGHQRHCH